MTSPFWSTASAGANRTEKAGRGDSGSLQPDTPLQQESFNSENSLFKYLQLFVISNGTDTRYFANTTKRDKNSFDFTMNWARSDNTLIKDLKDFTATFFQKHTLLNVLFNYTVFDVSNNLLIMRPYQIAATERILWKINRAYQAKNGAQRGGVYLAHHR
jgi:type I restriction enzyme R subunit